jgi:aminoacrylate hydrolase
MVLFCARFDQLAPLHNYREANHQAQPIKNSRSGMRKIHRLNEGIATSVSFLRCNIVQCAHYSNNPASHRVTSIDDFFGAYRPLELVLRLFEVDALDEIGNRMPYAGPSDALYYEDVGSGHPIFFIPGFGGVGSFWSNQIDFFRQRFRVITIDQRGAGASARSRQEYSLHQMTEDVQAVMDSARIDTAILVGHSTGGAIAQTLAVTDPDRVSGMLLSSTWCRPSNYFRRVFEFRRSLLEIGETDLFHKAGIFFRYPPDYADAHDIAFENSGDIDVEITIARINAILQADLSLVTGQINVPTLVVAARDDCLIPQYMSDEVARRIPDSKYVVMNQGGHFLPETRSNDYNVLLDNFMTGLDLPTSATGKERHSAS